ncbi:hypothetical protein TWF281_004078 [Arthrobotrys megalospora]
MQHSSPNANPALRMLSVAVQTDNSEQRGERNEVLNQREDINIENLEKLNIRSRGDDISRLLPVIVPPSVSPSVSSSNSLPARRPYLQSESSSRTSFTEDRSRPLIPIRIRSPRINPWEPNLRDVEISFLRVVTKAKVPIATPGEIKLDCVDRRLDTLSRHGATMQVHRGVWKDQRVAVKFIRRANYRIDGSEESRAEATKLYRRDMYDLNFELQIMSKKSLRSHPNITKLLGICFDAPEESFEMFAEPGLIVELAHDQHPDLASFFDHNSSPDRSHSISYTTGANLIADIGDGIQALHDHDLVHADIKPGNILLFPNKTSPSGLTAKIADFGFSGMTTYTHNGQRAPFPDGWPRGGTPEWNAPECFQTEDPIAIYASDDNLPSHSRTRDIYSFGLLVAYIALDGQSPKQYIRDLDATKFSDRMIETVVSQIEKHYLPHGTVEEQSLKIPVIEIIRNTLSFDPSSRTEALRNLKLREKLFNDTTTPTTWSTELFVRDFNLFPQSPHEFVCSGLHDVYWACPAHFRERVREAFKSLAEGDDRRIGQFVDTRIMKLLERPENGEED